MSILQLGPQGSMREDVRKLYEKYEHKIDRGALLMLSPPDDDKRFYVYEWFTKDAEKVFYVGKGTGRRYRHILYDMNRPRGAEYLELQTAFGIDYRFLAEGLTAREAEIYELCMILERTEQGEVLLQSAYNPGAEEYSNRLAHMREVCAGRNFAPEIIIDPYHRRYFSVTPPSYDPVDPARLRATFCASFSKPSPGPAVIREMDQLRVQIDRAGGKVYATVAKAVQTVVEFDNMDYTSFMLFKEKGLMVCHAFEVARYLSGK